MKETGSQVPHPGRSPFRARCASGIRRTCRRAPRVFSSRRRTETRGLLFMALAAMVIAWGVWQASRQMVRFDEDRLARMRPARICCDRNGTPVWAELGSGDQWRVPVPLSRVSPWLITAMVAVEDRRFFRHHGVDWPAGLRALLSNLRAGRVVSGASTITMQLAKLVHPEPRSYRYKYHQILRALDIETRHDKDWVLEQYLNLAPFGANLVGVEAAARAYLGKSARDLDLPEAALLAGLPQRPAGLRPDRHPGAAERRRRVVLDAMYRAGFIGRKRRDAAAAVTVSLLLPRQRNTVVARNRLGLPMTEPLFGRLALAAAPRTSAWVETTLDPGAQALVRTALHAGVERLPGVDDGAAVVIENATGAVRALVGTVDFTRSPGGQVNAACARRSPGSALKPIIYLAALDGGLIVPETVLDDSPLVLADYRPGNFDHRYRGRVTAQQALTASLNTPAVRLLRQVGLDRFLDVLRRCGVRSAARGSARPGLSAALGGVELSPLELADLYAGIARGGSFFPCRFVEHLRPGRPQPGAVPVAPGAVRLLTEMLSTCPLPRCPNVPLAWKTGTSSGRRDAWCAAWDRRWTIVVWLGNKDGRPSPALMGVRAAAPVAAAIAQGLTGGVAPPVHAPGPATHTVPVRICALTGLCAGPNCLDSRPARRPRGIPLRPCPERPGSGLARMADREGLLRLRILSPAPGTYLAESGAASFRLHAAPDVPCSWFVDGRFVGRRQGPLWVSLGPGRHRIVCVPPGAAPSARVEIEVRAQPPS